MFGLGKKKEDVVPQATSEQSKEVDSNVSGVDIIEDSSNDVTIEAKDVLIENSEEKKEEVPPLTYKEVRALKRSRYEKIAPKFNKAYVLKNRKTGQIVEVRAASSFHACNIIGWKRNRVQLIEEKIVEAPPKEQTTEISTGTSQEITQEISTETSTVKESVDVQ